MELLLGKWTPSLGDTMAGAAAGDTMAGGLQEETLWQGTAAGNSDKSCTSHLTSCCM